MRIFKRNPKRKILNKANVLISFLYNFQINEVKRKELTYSEKFAVLNYEQKIRELTEKLISDFKTTPKD